MPDVDLTLTRSINPVQCIQGYVERAETETIDGRIVQLQKSYPGATVKVFARKPDGQVQTTEPAKIFDRDGNFTDNPIILDPSTAFYQFYAQPGRYDIQFTGVDGGPVFMLEDVPVESLVFNVRDFGAVADGNTENPLRDDAVAIRAAIAAMKTANGGNLANGLGTLHFPNGIYIIRTPIDLPSGITLQGTNAQYSGNAASNCLLVLATPNSSIFTIKTNRQRIILRDLGMTTTTAGILAGSKAIDATEDVAGATVTGVEFDNLSIWGFDRGISVEGSHLSDQWDFNNVRVSHCLITECNYAIYLNSQNCDFWRIVDCRLGAALSGFSVYLARVGIITLDSILGAANLDPLLDALADSFIYLTAAHGTVTIINCQCEGFLNSINVSPSATGNISWPIVVLNSTLGDGVSLGHNCDYISIGNRYLPTSVHCNNDGNDVMIFSLGDIFAPNDPEVPLPAFDFQLQGNSRVVSRANRFRVDFQRPTRIGGQPGQPPANLPNIVQNPALALSPFSANGTQMALCDASGGKLFNLRADNEYVYFEDPRAHGGVRTLMRLDRGGNLTVKGAFTEDPDL